MEVNMFQNRYSQYLTQIFSVLTLSTWWKLKIKSLQKKNQRVCRYNSVHNGSRGYDLWINLNRKRKHNVNHNTSSDLGSWIPDETSYQSFESFYAHKKKKTKTWKCALWFVNIIVFFFFVWNDFFSRLRYAVRNVSFL